MSISISSDQLPLDKLKEFEHAAVGVVMTVHQRNGKATLMLITDIQDDSPMPFNCGRPYIEAHSSTMRDQQALNDYLKRAKTGAKIVYAEDMKPAPIGIVAHGHGISILANAVAK